MKDTGLEGLEPEDLLILKQFTDNEIDDLPDQLQTDLLEYYSNAQEIPYGTYRGRTGDPDQWLFDRLCEEFKDIGWEEELKNMPLVKKAKLVVYSALRRKPKRPHKRVAAAMGKIKIWEMEFPTENLGESMGFWSRSLRDYKRSTYSLDGILSDPKSKIALWFEGGKKECGLEPFKWYMMVNNRVFRRITYRDLGKKDAKSGLHVKRDGKCSIYLTPMKISKEDKAKIMEAVGPYLLEEN